MQDDVARDNAERDKNILKQSSDYHRALKLLQDAHDCIGMARYELGEEWDESNLEAEIGTFLKNQNK